MAGAVKSQELIQQLLQAEKQAEDIVGNAKKNRLAKLRQAKEKAEEELKEYRQTEEVKFNQEMGAKAAVDPEVALKETTQNEIAQVEKDYATNKAKTIQYVVSKVLEVSCTLSSTQAQALKSGAAH
eukprot:TRINITY_DN32513_c0_g1_i3.p1 TRINITY_DN32513_c0_g1~~TRINITY_DN32513_c0_g1_i3.p1  ORF type:complete len:126 (-),score=45.68 TRINITY_DN32513_c0_g1_i3:76-453(-)